MLTLAEEEVDGEACDEYVHCVVCVVETEADAEADVEPVEEALLDGHDVQEEDELGDAQDVPVV